MRWQSAATACPEMLCSLRNEVFKPPPKKGAIKGSASSVQCLALEVPFPIQNPLVLPQREARITWETEVFFRPMLRN